MQDGEVNRTRFAGRLFRLSYAAIAGSSSMTQYGSSASAGSMFPKGSRSRRWWLNRTTHSRVANSTDSKLRHGPRWSTNDLDFERPLIVWASTDRTVGGAFILRQSCNRALTRRLQSRVQRRQPIAGVSLTRHNLAATIAPGMAARRGKRKPEACPDPRKLERDSSSGSRPRDPRCTALPGRCKATPEYARRCGNRRLRAWTFWLRATTSAPFRRRSHIRCR